MNTTSKPVVFLAGLVIGLLVYTPLWAQHIIPGTLSPALAKKTGFISGVHTRFLVSGPGQPAAAQSAIINIKGSGAFNPAKSPIKTTAAAISGNAPVISYSSPQIYTPGVAITPLAPNNSGGAVPATQYGQVSTFAGNGQQTSIDGIGTQASFNYPIGITVDASGNLYVTDYNSIRKITPLAVVTTLAGSAVAGYKDGIGTAAMFNNPTGIATDGMDNIIVADNNYIRKVTLAGVVTTIAGNGTAGNANGTASAASFNSLRGITVDPSENIYITDDNNIIRKIDVAGMVTNFAGSGLVDTLNGIGAAASFRFPYGLCCDKSGNVYVADMFNDMIRKITPAGLVSTFAGFHLGSYVDGTGSTARFYYPTGVFADPDNNIFVTDSFNHRIRMITPGQVVTTVAGNGMEGSANGPAPGASFNFPLSSAFSQGNLYVTDMYNNLIRKITLTGYTIDKALPPGLMFDSTTGIISGTPLSPFPTTVYTITARNASGVSSTSINLTVLAAGTLLPSVITFTIVPGNIVLDANNDFSPGATSTNNESPITYTSSNPAVATITPDGLVHVVGVGVSIITASQAGSTHYSAAQPVSQTLTVKEYEVINFPALGVKYEGDPDFAPGATSDVSIYPITYTSSNPAVATIVNGQVHIVGPGITQITASQAGDTWYIEAAPVTQQLEVDLGITFNPLPVKTTCDGDFDPGATGNGPFTYTSSNSAVAVIVSGKLHITGAGTTTITASNGKTSLTQLLVVNPVVKPVINITSSSSDAVCAGSSVSFTAVTNVSANTSYQWLLNGNKVGPNSAVYSAASFSNNDVVACTVTDNSTNCIVALKATSNAIVVLVNPAVTPAVVINPASPVCQGSPVTLTATATNAGGSPHYQWQVNNVSTGTDNTAFTYLPNNGDVVTVNLTSSVACAAPVTSTGVTMQVNALPLVSFDNAPAIARGKTFQLNPEIKGNISSYSWMPSTGLSSAAIANPVASPLVTTTYQLHVVSSSGCDGFGAVTITVQEFIKAPNTFTPNGDGINDLWNIPALKAYPKCSVMIYTRYGNLIYNSTGYAKSWDGTYNNQALPVGVYYYVIDTRDGKPATAGYVTLLR